MKRIIIIIIILSAFIKQSYCQDKPSIRLSASGSFNLSWLKPNTKGYENTGILPRWSYGILFDFPISNNIFFSPGLAVDYCGGKLRYYDSYYISEGVKDTGWLKRTYSLQYINLPITFKMKTDPIKGMKFYFQFGVGVGIKIKSTSDDSFTNNRNKIYDFSDVDLKSNVTPLKLSMIVGAGTEIPISGNTCLLLGLGFSNGLTNILSGTNSFDGTKNNKAIANYFAISAGILF